MEVQQYKIIAASLAGLTSSSIHANTIGSSATNPVIALLKMSVALVFVLCLLWALAALLKRFKSPSLHAKHGLKLISTYNLGQREKLVVMQVGEEQLLLGVSPSAISTLHVLPTPLDQHSAEVPGNFKNILNAAITREIST